MTRMYVTKAGLEAAPCWYVSVMVRLPRYAMQFHCGRRILVDVHAQRESPE